jgi:PEP-CTERM motif
MISVLSKKTEQNPHFSRQNPIRRNTNRRYTMVAHVFRAALLVSAALLAFVPSQASAGLIGSTVNSQYLFPTTGSLYENDGTQVVNPTATFTSQGIFTITVSDNKIVFNAFNFSSFWNPASFNGPSLDFLGVGNLIQSVTVDPATNMSGFNSSLVSLSPDGSGGQFVRVNWQNLSFNGNTNVTLDITTAPTPEPTSIAIFAVMGIAGSYFGWRRRQAA